MFALFEGLWYALYAFIQIIWIPALVFLGVGLIARLIGMAVRGTKKKK